MLVSRHCLRQTPKYSQPISKRSYAHFAKKRKLDPAKVQRTATNKATFVESTHTPSEVNPVHIPVLLKEVIDSFKPLAQLKKPTILDMTYGMGGHSKALLESYPNCNVVGLDRDLNVLQLNLERPDLQKYLERKRLQLAHGTFSSVQEVLNTLGIQHLDGVLFDVGVSSIQIDSDTRGFSYRTDSPLDMRMDNSVGHVWTAKDYVNTMTPSELSDMIHKLGEESISRSAKIAHGIAERRKKGRIETTKQLVDCINRAVSGTAHNNSKRYSQQGASYENVRKTFQALRIKVNDELSELQLGLVFAGRYLNPGGVLSVISFHSLEDRIVKRYFKIMTGDAASNEIWPGAEKANEHCKARPVFEMASKEILPTNEEIKINRRSRSAKMRTGTRTAHPNVSFLLDNALV